MFQNGFDVCFVSVGADHHDPCSELGVNHVISYYLNSSVSSWDLDFQTDILRIAFILRMYGYGDTRVNHLGPGGGNL